MIVFYDVISLNDNGLYAAKIMFFIIKEINQGNN